MLTTPSAASTGRDIFVSGPASTAGIGFVMSKAETELASVASDDFDSNAASSNEANLRTNNGKLYEE